MLTTAKPLWFEGQLIRPQHLQQFSRWVENDGMCRQRLAGDGAWGVFTLGIDETLLPLGKIGLSNGSLVFPDGTLAEFPTGQSAPEPLQITQDMADLPVWLCVALRSGDGNETGDECRLTATQVMLRDTADEGSVADVKVGYPTIFLMAAHTVPDNCVGVPLCRVHKLTPDGVITLDTDYAPPSLRTGAHPLFARLAREVQGILSGRANMLARRLEPSKGGYEVSDLADFALLQLINSMEPVFQWFAQDQDRRPVELYEHLLKLVAALATFGRQTRRPPELPMWSFHNPGQCLRELVELLRVSLGQLSVDTATPIPLEHRATGLWVGMVADRTLFDNARFVLMASGSLDPEQLRRLLPGMTKIAAAENIQEIINLQLPGVPLSPLPVAPRELPYRWGTVYLELDRASALWAQLQSSAAMVVHIGSVIPDLKLELWALRQHG
ncbi:MAG: type VI secretion system baseplate subunit TssK [Acetobacter sp.]